MCSHQNSGRTTPQQSSHLAKLAVNVEVIADIAELLFERADRFEVSGAVECIPAKLPQTAIYKQIKKQQ